MKVRVKIQNFFYWTFILQFGLVCFKKMLCKFFLCWCHKYLWIKFFSFGEMNSALRHWANSLHEHNIVLRIWNVCFACQILTYGKKTKHCLLTTIRARPLKCNGLFIASFRKDKLSKNKIQWLDLAFICCSHWLDCHWWRLVAFTMKSLSNILSHI